MNYFNILFLFSLAFSTTLAQWTNQNPVPNSNRLSSVFFVDDNNGWIVGSKGFIIKTTNAGEEWIEMNSGTATNLKAVNFVDENIGWTIGETGLIIKSTNGGIDWTPQSSGTPENLNSVDFFDDNLGWVTGYNGTLLRTTNGGGTWTSLVSGTTEDLYSICFVNDLTGWAVGGQNDGIILKTTDGGNIWVEQVIRPGSPFLSVFFLDENIGWTGGDSGGLKTTDGGNTWVYNNTLPFNSIFFKDSNNGYYVGGTNGVEYYIFITTDGGATWMQKVTYWQEENILNKTKLSDCSELLSVLVTNEGKGWAVGGYGKIYTTNDNGNTWSKQLAGSYESISEIHFVSEQIGWAVGNRVSQPYQTFPSIILKTTNSGRVWNTQLAYGNYDINNFELVFFIDELHGWTYNTSIVNNILKTTDGGDSWDECELPSEYIYTKSIFFIDQYTGWLAGNNIILKSTDGGETFIEKYSSGGSSIYFIDEFNGWVVGDNGNILKSTDGGETWVPKTSGTIENLTAVKFYNSNIGMCIGNGGTVLLSTDSGETWTTKTGPSLQTINFTNSTTVWGYTSDGEIYKTTNSGDTWNSLNTGLGSGQTSFFINENTGWVAGTGGLIFKYKNQSAIPVELISFTAVTQNQNVKLNWKTATELNNNGFEVERKICSGQSLTANFEKISFVKGAGTTSEAKNYLFTDENLINGKYIYRLKQIDLDGTFNYSNEIHINLVSPAGYLLEQNYPNPFNPTTKIRYHLPKESKVVIKIYNILGSEVMELVNEQKESGIYEVEFNAESLSSGTYVYRIIADNFIQTKKMILLK